MVALFEMIVAGFIRFFAFFGKYVGSSNARTIFDMLRFTSRKAFLVILVALILAFVALAFSFFYYMISVITTVYNLISHLIIMIQSPSGIGGGTPSPMLQGAMMLINASGIAQGISSAFPFIASALTFRLMVVLYRAILKLYEFFVVRFGEIIALVTAA
ncbi:MAG: hypothetical protein WCW84_04745 [Sulfurimonas sp.]|jgi:hypothetical protein